MTTAQLGNLTNTVTASGSFVFGSKESLSFGSAGTVAEVAVKEGDAVTEGQVIARFDYAVSSAIIIIY